MLQLLTPHGPRPVQAMLFDMDGTMADSRPFHLEAWERMAQRLRPGADRAAVVRRTFGLSNRQIVPLLAAHPMSLEQIDALSEEKEALYRGLARGRVRPIPGLGDLAVRATQCGVRLGVASSAIEANVRFILEEFGLAPYFAAVAHAGRVRKGKPDPETVLLAANDLGAPPARCVVFEDAPAGLEAARRAGMIAVAIQTHPQPGLADWAELLAGDFRDILDCLRG